MNRAYTICRGTNGMPYHTDKCHLFAYYQALYTNATTSFRAVAAKALQIEMNEMNLRI